MSPRAVEYIVIDKHNVSFGYSIRVVEIRLRVLVVDRYRLPLKRVLSYEPDEYRTYTDAHRLGHEGGNCATMFGGCNFSLIDMALGKYSMSNDEDNTLDTNDRRYNNPLDQSRPGELGKKDTGTSETLTPVRYAMK